MSRETDLTTRESVNEDFVANTSISVIPRLRLKHIGRRAFWLITLVLSLFVFLWQFYLLLGKYFSYPISVNIEMGFKELDFPAVSICNHNRFRSSQLYLGGQSFVDFVEKANDDLNQQLRGDLTNTRHRQSRGTAPVILPWNASQGLDPDLRKSRRKEPFSTMSPNGGTTTDEDSRQPDVDIQPIIDTGEPQWDAEEASVDFQTPVKLGKAAAAVGRYYPINVNLTDKPWFAPGQPDQKSQTEERMAIIMSKIPVSVKSAMGHSVTDFIQEVVWNGNKLSPDAFSLFSSNMFGNCYTFNAATLTSDRNTVKKAKKPGPDFGLRLTLLLEQDEYMSGAFSATAGARIVLHDPAAPAFPENKGIDVHPGQMTNIGIKFLEFSRLVHPWGNCSNGENSPFVGKPILYDMNGKYSIEACERSCRQYHNLDRCQCAESGTPAPENSTLCTSENASCLEQVRQEYNDGELTCNCDPPCSEKRYAAAQSVSMWPSQAYVASLKAGMSDRGGRIKQILDKGGVSLAENLLKVNIFYEDLNYEHYQEVATYGIENLLGDLGGQLGLWMGLTVLSFMEVAEYIGLLIICIFSNNRNGKRKPVNCEEEDDELTTRRL